MLGLKHRLLGFLGVYGPYSSSFHQKYGSNRRPLFFFTLILKYFLVKKTHENYFSSNSDLANEMALSFE